MLLSSLPGVLPLKWIQLLCYLCSLPRIVPLKGILLLCYLCSLPAIVPLNGILSPWYLCSLPGIVPLKGILLLWYLCILPGIVPLKMIFLLPRTPILRRQSLEKPYILSSAPKRCPTTQDETTHPNTLRKKVNDSCQRLLSTTRVNSAFQHEMT